MEGRAPPSASMRASSERQQSMTASPERISTVNDGPYESGHSSSTGLQIDAGCRGAEARSPRPACSCAVCRSLLGAAEVVWRSGPTRAGSESTFLREFLTVPSRFPKPRAAVQFGPGGIRLFKPLLLQLSHFAWIPNLDCLRLYTALDRPTLARNWRTPTRRLERRLADVKCLQLPRRALVSRTARHADA